MYLSNAKSNRKEVEMFSKYWNEETKALTDEERNIVLSDWECEDYPMGYKFVAKTHRLAYGMKATYTFYLSFA